MNKNFTSEQYLMMADYFASIPSVEASVYAETTEMLRYAAEMAKKFEQTEPFTWAVVDGEGTVDICFSFREMAHEHIICGIAENPDDEALIAQLSTSVVRPLYAAPQPAIPEGMK